MNYLGLGVVGRAGARLYSSCKDLYNDLNGANLTGAVDIVVVKQTDGSYKATPFHVRFGKFGVLRTGDLQKEVEVEVNGESVSNRMMLDESGMAFFVKPRHSLSSDPSTDSIYESRSHSFDSISDTLYEPDCVELVIDERSEDGTPVETLTTDHLSLETCDITTHTDDSSNDTLTEGPSNTETVDSLVDSAYEGTLVNIDSSSNHPSTIMGDTMFSGDDPNITTDTSEMTSESVPDVTDDDSVPNVTGDDSVPNVTSDNSMTNGLTRDDGVLHVTSDHGVPSDDNGVPNGAIDDSVPNVTSDDVPNVTSDDVPNVTSDDVVPNVTSDDSVTDDNKVSSDGHLSDHVHSKSTIMIIDLDKQQSVATCTSHDKLFFTPTDDPKNLDWLVNSNNSDGNGMVVVPYQDLTGDLDSGVLSDSALDMHTTKQKYHHVNEVHSDSELDGRNDKTNGEPTQFTMTEVSAAADRQPLSSNNMSRSYSLWGALTGIWSRRKRRRFSNIEDGIYLEELDNGRMGDEEKAQYLPTSSPEQLKTSASGNNMECPSDSSSGVDSSSQQSSPVRGFKSDQQNIEDIVSMLSDISISQCGWDEPVTEESFNQSQISFDEFCSNINVLSSSNTVIRIGEKYYNWLVAGPIIMSALLYQQHLPSSCQKNLEQNHMYKTKSRQLSKNKSRWSLWSKEAAVEAKFGKPDQLQGNSITTIFETTPTTATPIITTANTTQSSRPVLNMSQSLPATRLITEDPLSSDEEVENERSLPRVRQRSLRRKRLVFTNELTSEELSSWPLKSGKNELVFSITTKYQGTAKARCSLYLWNHDEKIVVSDFDGTITRSDVAGQVLPFLGKDWTHFGVIELFSAIHDNGYRLLYLSARAIGQSMYTKNYLRNTRSRNYSLPDGPLLVTPFSLYKAFKKEVIERKPEEFKILCLQQIRAFFPDNYNPFHAGFGNKPSDAKSYLEVEIPSSRIFTVNPKGEIKNELTWTFQSSYIGLMEFVDAQFPSIFKSDRDNNGSGNAVVSDTLVDGDTMVTSSPMVNENYSSFMYWQQPFNSFESFDLPDS